MAATKYKNIIYLPKQNKYKVGYNGKIKRVFVGYFDDIEKAKKALDDSKAGVKKKTKYKYLYKTACGWVARVYIHGAVRHVGVYSSINKALKAQRGAKDLKRFKKFEKEYNAI